VEIKIFLILFFFLILSSNSFAECDAKLGMTYNQYKKILQSCNSVSKDTFGKDKFIKESYSGDYTYWEKYYGVSTEVIIWLQKDKVVKTQKVLNGSEVNTISGAKNVFNNIKDKHDIQFGISKLIKSSDGQVAMWEADKTSIILSLELPQSKYGLPIVKIVEVLRGYAK